MSSAIAGIRALRNNSVYTDEKNINNDPKWHWMIMELLVNNKLDEKFKLEVEYIYLNVELRRKYEQRIMDMIKTL